MNLLLMDKDKFAVENVKQMIDRDEFGLNKVYTTYTVHQAKTICENYDVEVAFCEIDMPKESGLDFVKWLRKEDRQLPVIIFLTDQAVFDYAQQAVGLGVEAYLLKPARMGEIRRVLYSARENAAELRRKLETGDRIREMKNNSVTIQDNVQTVRNYIAEHYQQPLNRENLAELVYLNPNYLSRQFKKFTGRSLMDYVNCERIIRAKQMLKESDLAVSEISGSVGFSNTAYFTRIFKKYANGLSPKEFRRRCAK